MRERHDALAAVRELARSAERDVNRFFGSSVSFPLSVGTNSGDMLRMGLLPWARSGLRETIIVRYPGISTGEIAHEMSHFSLRRVCAGQPVPLWFDEGLACYLGDASPAGSEAEVKRLLHGRRAPPITRWSGTRGKIAWLLQMYGRGNTRLIYGLSLYMVRRLVARNGEDALGAFVTMLGDAEFDAAFSSVYGVRVWDFYTDEVIPQLLED